MMSDSKRECTPVGKGTNVPESNLGSYRVKASVTSGSPSDSGEGKNRKVVGDGRGAKGGKGGKSRPELGKSHLPLPRVVVHREQGGKKDLLERQRLEQARERAIWKRRARGGETPFVLDSTVTGSQDSVTVQSRSDSGGGRSPRINSPRWNTSRGVARRRLLLRTCCFWTGTRTKRAVPVAKRGHRRMVTLLERLGWKMERLTTPQSRKRELKTVLRRKWRRTG
ncbi:hypothetical protein TKK_0016597 [Trichogramma kaykai]